VHLSVSNTTTKQRAPTPVVVTAQLQGVTSGLKDKSVELFVSCCFQCNTLTAATDATGKALFSCHATGAGDAEFEATFDDNGTPRGGLQPAIAHVLASTTVSAPKKSWSATAPAPPADCCAACMQMLTSYVLCNTAMLWANSSLGSCTAATTRLCMHQRTC
jgi:hypothetical protein